MGLELGIGGIIAVAACGGAWWWYFRVRKSKQTEAEAIARTAAVARDEYLKNAVARATTGGRATEDISPAVSGYAVADEPRASVPAPAAPDVPPEITAFIVSCRTQGISDVQIKIQLLDAGWPREVVEAGLALR